VTRTGTKKRSKSLRKKTISRRPFQIEQLELVDIPFPSPAASTPRPDGGGIRCRLCASPALRRFAALRRVAALRLIGLTAQRPIPLPDLTQHSPRPPGSRARSSSALTPMAFDALATACCVLPVLVSLLAVRVVYVLWRSGQPRLKPDAVAVRCLIVLGSGEFVLPVKCMLINYQRFVFGCMYEQYRKCLP
jgi:hypothetical protein